MSLRIPKNAFQLRPTERLLCELSDRPNRSAGRTVLQTGYLYEYAPEHPLANHWGHVQQHRLVAEHYLCRPLRPGEVIHHEDDDKRNNSPGNLRIFASNGRHIAYHHSGNACWSLALAERAQTIELDRSISMVDAARLLGMSKGTLGRLLANFSIHWRRRSTADLDEQSVREALRGRTTFGASKILGVNHNTLRSRFPELLEKRASPGTLALHKEEIRSLATRERASQIGRRFGVCRQTVSLAMTDWARLEPDAWSDALAFQRSRRGLGRPPRRTA